MNKKKIIDYYDQAEIDYRLLWHLDSEMALHYGFWDETTKSLHRALQKENEVLAEKAKIKKGDFILDAGCGVGGSALFLAEKYGCKVIGITLSQKQAKEASMNAIKHGVDGLVKFEVRDFTHTNFPNGTFDTIWAVESVCYANDKQKFAKEAFRILKKDGRLILADFFSTHSKLEPKNSQIMDNWLGGWSVQALETMDNFNRYLNKAGFKRVELEDMTLSVIPSAKRLYFYSFPGLILGSILKFLGFRSTIQHKNTKAAYYQYQTLRKDLWRYGLLLAIK